MASTKLPTINFSIEAMKPGSSSWLSTSKLVRSSLEEYGCFVAQYDQITAQLLDQIFAQSKDLFDVPLENKLKNLSDEPYHGYVGPNPYIPLYESLAIDNVNPKETQKFKDLMWPDGKKNFCEITDLFAQLIVDLEHAVEQMVFESYGAGKTYESVASENTHLLRFLKYNKPEEGTVTDETLRFPSHTDQNFCTIVIQHDVGGLEVKTKEGDWLNFDSKPSQFMFLAGEGLKVWSNDRVQACQHRVKHCQDETRYSLGLFTFNNGVIHVPKEVIDDEHPLLYKPFDSRGFIKFYATEEGRSAKYATNAYCGIDVKN